MNYTSDSSSTKTSDLASKLQETHGIKALPVQADMGTENGPAHIVATALNHFSHPKTRKLQIDIIINNAGVAANMPIQDCTSDEFHRQYNVNVRGPLFLIKAALPHLPTDRSGRIVNVSSVSASLGFHQQSIYGGTKAALEAMTRVWANELAERATVNAVNPGPVATDMYGGVSDEFQERVGHWLAHTPLAAVREGVDREDFVRDAAKSKGRPVSCFSSPLRPLFVWLRCPFADMFFPVLLRLMITKSPASCACFARRMEGGVPAVSSAPTEGSSTAIESGG